MSQHPSPYQQPPHPPSPYSQSAIDYSPYGAVGYGEDPYAPARRAATLQGILGGLTLACGVIVGALPRLVNIGEAFQKAGVPIPQLPPGWSFDDVIRIGFTALGGCGFVLGVGLLALSFFVRSGSRGAVITSMVLVILILLLLAVRVIGGIVQLASNPMAAIIDLLFDAVLIALFGLNLKCLFAAMKSGAAAAMLQRQYLAQYYQMQQQQQAYAQPGYAYPPPPPPAAPSKSEETDVPPPT